MVEGDKGGRLGELDKDLESLMQKALTHVRSA